jgi:hypothetical protein
MYASIFAVVSMAARVGFGSAVTSPEQVAWSDVVASYAPVRDYQCLYEKEERAISSGELQTIRLSFRKPADVRLEWLDGKGRPSQVAVFRQGFNDGKLLARRFGVFGSALGTVRLDPRGSRALANSRHPITEVGIGHIIERAAEDLRGGLARVLPAREDTLDSQLVDRFEFEATSDVPLYGIPGARRAVIWVDPALKLPIKAEVLDAAGTVLERHRFKQLRLNVGLTDDMFTL